MVASDTYLLRTSLDVTGWVEHVFCFFGWAVLFFGTVEPTSVRIDQPVIWYTGTAFARKTGSGIHIHFNDDCIG